ncbi:L-ribulose-5-phosphate 3-epimerase [Bifidobacterium simiarum]|uniref:Xylulose 5-phosphate 3-epimerase n=1 Tax=Bifidobacterium simiarum TaxID=2045441 RepID=A0A2M9HEV0_9BIFI|nr:L-ribulose-5-phosphate 3-epimerase [Bifidobacterium simiarum]MBT1165632.1 L-ribulose-5-phosphate 3-epimerase [Bifidobacterium simiarum]PJM75332.1 xylulose 5-phosphate 3-epimerase [Bifidobacterium simiarum]
MQSISLGIYEKALTPTASWKERFSQVHDLGFDFMDISIDESDERLSRLSMDMDFVREIGAEAKRSGVMIGGVCLSAHRRYALGSPDSEKEEKGREILFRSIDFAKAVGSSLVQLAGYYTFYEPHDHGCRERFLKNLRDGVQYAAQQGVMLGIENVDGEDITDLHELNRILKEVSSPWLQAYPDVGNSAFNFRDVRDDLQAVKGHVAAIHVKDVLPGKPRKVPFGQGIADFGAAFMELKAQRWSGRMMIEMWNEDTDADRECRIAKEFIEAKLRTYGLWE